MYQYYFVGKRAALPDEPSAPATEFIFDVTSDRKTTFAVSVLVPEKSISRMERRSWPAAQRFRTIRRRQTAPVRAFDEIENMSADGRRLLVTAQLEDLLASLGVDA